MRPHSPQSWQVILTVRRLVVSKVFAHAAGDIDRRPRDVTGPVAGEKRDQPSHLVGAAEPAERHLLRGKAPEELRGRGVGCAQTVDVLPLWRPDKPNIHT